MDALLRRLSRTGLRRGLSGGHWAWLVLAGAAYLLRRARRRDEASTTLDLSPGERYVVRLVPPARRRDRRRGRGSGSSGTVGHGAGARESGTGGSAGVAIPGGAAPDAVA